MVIGRHGAQAAQPRFRRTIATAEAIAARRFFARNEYVEQFEDFLGDAGQTLPPPWRYTETGTSTNPTGDYVSAADGRFALTHSADSEAQTMRIDWGDNLLINMSKKPRLEVRAAINFAGATFSADQRLVIGFVSAYNATLDSTTHNAWFRIEGANLNILTESDDNTTNDDDNDTGIDIVDNTMTVFEIDVVSLTDVRFMVNGASAGSLSMAALPANSMVQPIIAIQRDAGTEAEVLTVDYCQVTWERT
jgi:hypothetical protein